MIKVVLDTNIFISSIFWKKGNPHKIVELALDKKIRSFTSLEILQELEKVLRRDFQEPEEIIQRQIALILECSTVVKPSARIYVVKDDPEDNKIVECAISCNADYIVTGDRHLLDLDEYEGIKIVKAKELVDIVIK